MRMFICQKKEKGKDEKAYVKLMKICATITTDKRLKSFLYKETL